MKEFRKNVEGLFICEECNRLFKNQKAINVHTNKTHNKKQYFDKWLKENDEGLCKICGKEAKFIGSRGYQLWCSKKCALKIRQKHLEENNLLNYGVKNTYERKDVKDKCKKIWGCDNPFQRKDVKEKCKQTTLKNWGVENCSSSSDIKKKKEETCFKNYGVNYNAQNKEIHEKQLKSAFKFKQYKHTDIWYQGSFELDFLEKYYNKCPDIRRGPSIEYIFNEKNKIYHPDFYIASLNLIVEIKNLYLYKRYEENIETKEKATIANGFNYIIIVNKDYSSFNQFLHI